MTPDGGFLIADTCNDRIRCGFSGDGGPATEAKIYGPHNVQALPEGGFLISDKRNHRIRKVDASGTITSIVGTGIAGFGGDGGPAVEAQLNEPRWVDLTQAGNNLIADTLNHRVRFVDGY